MSNGSTKSIQLQTKFIYRPKKQLGLNKIA